MVISSLDIIIEVDTLEEFIEIALCSMFCGALCCLFLAKKFLLPPNSNVFTVESPSVYEEYIDHEQLLIENPDRALDFIGKELGQYATMELLTDQYVKMHNEFTKQKRSVNVVKELIPQIKTRAYKVKELAAKLGKDKTRDKR